MNMEAFVQSAQFPATRSAGLAQLRAFAAKAGADYAQWRNYDFGAGAHQNVSCLSPYIRHRLITEEEVVRTVLAQHSAEAAEKFIQEVYWRTYWKGWLEMRPGIWADYLTALDQMGAPNDAAQKAMLGRTGIACFDHWAEELVETGYLHNHARMWFASIWIFTLGLPWHWGADFFLRHLLDGDPASNTLSWRWVAGLQTPGKTYLATPENITTFTQGRFTPLSLHHGPAPVAEPNPPAAPLPLAASAPEAPSLLLLTVEDLHAENLPLPQSSIAAIAGLAPEEDRASPIVTAFRRAALDDGMARAAAHFGRTAEILDGEAVVAHAKALGLSHIITAYAPIGPTASALARLSADCAAKGVQVHQIRRSWDEAAWPLATKGFFPFRQHIPELLPK